MAVDDAGLEAAEVQLAPGDVEWDEDVGRFKARIEQLLMGDVKRLPGLIPLLPNPKAPDFDAAVQSAFEAFASTWRQQPPSRCRGIWWGGGSPSRSPRRAPSAGRGRAASSPRRRPSSAYRLR